MNQQQLSDLARALAQECSAQTLTALSDALNSAQGDAVVAASLQVVVDTARDVRSEAEQQAVEQTAPKTLGEALQRDRAAGRR